MKSIYLCYFTLILLLIITVLLVYYLSFSVPTDELHPKCWLFQHKSFLMNVYFFLILLLIFVSIISYLSPGVIIFETPLSNPGIFIISTTILLLSTFFVSDVAPERNFDSHPLLFYTAIMFIILAITTGIVNIVKKKDYLDFNS